MFTCAPSFNKNRNPMIISVKTDNSGTSNNDQFTLPSISNGAYEYYTKTTDGVSSLITAYDDADITTTFSGGAGTYTIEIHGKFEGWKFDNGGDCSKLITISQWGSDFNLGGRTGNTWRQFRGCDNLTTISCLDVLNMSKTNHIYGLFVECSSLTSINRLNDWDFSHITSAFSMFLNTAINQEIDFDMPLNVSLYGFFKDNTVFNSSVTINAPLATAANEMFHGCSIFDSAIDLNLSSCTNFSKMFRNSAFNQSLANLDTSAGTNFEFMFENVTEFNQPVTNLVTSNATTIKRIFDGATSFNQDVSSWDVSNATLFNGVFWGASSFNQSLSSWTTSSMTNLTNFIQGATVFDQDISHFDISNLTSASNMAISSGFSQTNYDKLLNTTTGWPSQATIQSGVTAHFGSAQYGAGDPTTGRGILTGSPNNWTITDGGQA
jgi:hypothetical protein